MAAVENLTTDMGRLFRYTILVLASLLALQAYGANLYRYRDDQGRTFTASQVPAAFVKNGYEVLNERGQVIQVVPRSLTEAELAAQADEREQLRLAEEARQRQEESDMLLLRLYRSPEEVIRRRDSTIEELEAQITALGALREDAQERVGQLQERADNNIAAGREVPANVVSQLEDATEERDRLQRQIDRLENERQETLATADQNIERLKQLLNLD